MGLDSRSLCIQSEWVITTWLIPLIAKELVAVGILATIRTLGRIVFIAD